MDVREYRERFSRRRVESYAASFAPVTDRFLDEVCAAVGDAPRVLDLGCGIGSLTARLRDGGHDVVAADHTPAMAAVARQRTGAPVVVADALHLPFTAGSFDAVAALFVLPHLNDLAAGIAEARRVLRPGGRLVLTGWADPDQAPYTGLAGRLLQEFAADFERDALAEATRRTDPGYLADVVAAHGFDRPAVTTLATTVEEPSAVAWWRALAVGSSGFADLFSAQAPAVQRAVRSRFLAAAADYAGADGTLQVPVTAHLCAATAG